MTSKSEIPCTLCRNYDSATRNFSCDPDKCQKLTKWLFDHTQIRPLKSTKYADDPIQYVV